MRALVSGAAAGALAATALRLLRAVPPGGALRWERTNHAGRTVTLLEGPAYAMGAGAAAALLGAGPGPVVATMGAAGFGALDDLAGDHASKGLGGHLGALTRGEVTTGAVKVLGLAATGLLSAALVDRRSHGIRAVDTVVGGAVIAGAANLLNLLDLRPGRALKVAMVLGVALSGSTSSNRAAAATTAAASAGAAAGAALGVLRPDLHGQTMLGDTGANSAGALLGTALVQRCGRRGRWTALAALTALTLASERVSFTSVIESTPVLRELDALGRR